MVGRSDHEDAVVGFETVNFVEEVGAHLVADEGVEVFEDEVARGHLAGFVEDGGESVFRAGVLFLLASCIWLSGQRIERKGHLPKPNSSRTNSARCPRDPTRSSSWP